MSNCTVSTAIWSWTTTATLATALLLMILMWKLRSSTPFCGDRATLQLSLDEKGNVRDVSAVAEGCSIIQAATSMLSGLLQGKSLDEVGEIGEKFRVAMKNGAEADEADLGDLLALQVVRQYPVRIKCALLPLTALEEGIKAYRSKAQ